MRRIPEEIQCPYCDEWCALEEDGFSPCLCERQRYGIEPRMTEELDMALAEEEAA